MDYSSVFAINNEVNQDKPPPRVCPRCNSNNTKFCYYNNYTVTQPRYKCKECRRHWTHGGALRNIPIGGNSRKISAKIQQVNRRRKPFLGGQETNQFVGYFGGSSSSSIADIQQVNRRHQPFLGGQESNQFVGYFGGSSSSGIAEIQQGNRRHQPFLGGQESNQFVGYFGGSSSSAIANGNQVGYFPETHGDMVLPFQNFPPMDCSNFHNALFQHVCHNVESNDWIGNYCNNQPIGGYNVLGYDHNSYINQWEDQNKWNHQTFNNTMNMNHSATTSGNREPWETNHMNMNNCVSKSSYHW